jgi:hypothetical protein
VIRNGNKKMHRHVSPKNKIVASISHSRLRDAEISSSSSLVALVWKPDTIVARWEIAFLSFAARAVANGLHMVVCSVRIVRLYIRRG